MSVSFFQKLAQFQNEKLAPTWHGILTRIGFILLIVAVMGYLRAERIFTVDKNLGGYAIVSLGFILLAAHNLSIVLAILGLPHVTSYMLIGIVCGPYCFNLLAEPLVAELGLVNNLALSLIAFIAGGELRLRTLRERWKSVLYISIFETLCVFGGCAIVFWFLTAYIPFTAGTPVSFRLAITLLLAGYIIVNSPAVVIGVINEYQSKGPVSQTVLGVVVVKDIIVVLIFSLTIAIAKALTSETEQFEMLPFVTHFGWEIVISSLIGILVGVVVSIYLKYIKTDLIIFTVGIGLLCYQTAKALQLDGILLCLVAGFYVENFTRQGDTFIQNIEHTLGVVFAIFFCVAGAKMNIEALQSVWIVALIMVGVRLIALYCGCWIGSRQSVSSLRVEKYAWLGLISQAGVALGFVVVIEQTFPNWGHNLSTIMLGLIAIFQLIGPVAFRFALAKSKELDPQRVSEDETLLREWDRSITPEDLIK
ncbi:MAG: cation:proton antiporter [Acidobacteria bacterium]|nr:cation:proton antiporter [Acidobacteriota bacterium]